MCLTDPRRSRSDLDSCPPILWLATAAITGTFESDILVINSTRFRRRTHNAKSNQGERIAKASGAGGRPLEHRRLAPTPDAASPANRQAVGRDDPSDNPRPALCRQVEEALLRPTRTRVDPRTSRIRRFRECRVPPRCGLRLPTATRNHRPDAVRQGNYRRGGTAAGAT